MPNWCATNWIVAGNKKTVKDLVSKFNKIFNYPVDKNNYFGKNWLGSLYAILTSKDPENERLHDNIRGAVDPEPYACACLSFNSPNSKMRFKPYKRKDGRTGFQFTTQSAWATPEWLAEYFQTLEENDEEFEFGFKATDEFGSFHTVENKELVKEIYEVDHEDGDWFELGHEEAFANCITSITGLTFDMDRIRRCDFSELRDKVDEWNNEHPDEECFVNIYKEND